jgi:pimeloyl-ACP methyl ester carboxylesterase
VGVPTIVLVHSPLVGPLTWRGVAEELTSRGYETIVPDLRSAAEQHATAAAIVDSAVSQFSGSAVILVGHSGAGLLLPSIAERANSPVTAFCFVDAHLPPRKGEVPLADAEFFSLLTSIASDGRLPTWSSWWGPHAMESLVPDAAMRREISDDMPSLSLDYFRQVVHAVDGWPTTCGYVRLSEAYEPSASKAEQLGWPVKRLSAGHLHGVVDPASVSERILQVIGELPTT